MGRVPEVGNKVVDTEVDRDMVHRAAEAGILVAAGIRDTSEPLDTWAEVAQEVVGKVQDTWAAWVSWAVVEAAVVVGSWGTWGVSVVSEAEDTFGSISSVVEVSLVAWGTGLGKAVDRAAVGWGIWGSWAVCDSKVGWVGYTSREADTASVARRAVYRVRSADSVGSTIPVQISTTS